MGAQIEGLGTPKLTIHGVSQLHPTDHTTIPDRIVTGTWAFAAAMTRGDITIHGGRAQDLEVPLENLPLLARSSLLPMMGFEYVWKAGRNLLMWQRCLIQDFLPIYNRWSSLSTQSQMAMQ